MRAATGHFAVEAVLLDLVAEGEAALAAQGPCGPRFDAELETVLARLAEAGALHPWPPVRDALVRLGIAGEGFGT